MEFVADFYRNNNGIFSGKSLTKSALSSLTAIDVVGVIKSALKSNEGGE